MRILIAVCVALVTAQPGGGPGPGAGGSFIEQKDRDLARQADLKVETACAKVPELDITEEDRTARREDLVKASADNIILSILRAANSPADLETEMEAQALNPGFLLFQAGPLIAFIFFLVLYVLYFCWACLPCCWCQCCRRKRNCPLVVKIIFMVLFGGIVLGLIIAASLSIRGFNAASEGFEITQCTAAEMVNRTLGGDAEFRFLGVIRTLEIFQELQDSLNAGSPFLNDLEGILDNTKPITDAVAVAAATLTNLQSMFAATQNTAPTAGGSSLLHSCQLCSSLEAPVGAAVTALQSGVGQALADTRGVVADQLRGDNLQQLRDSMLSGSAPLVELKTLVHAAFGPFVQEDTLEAVSELLGSIGTLSSVALIGVALLLAACSLLTGVCWICIETSKDKEGRTSHRRTTCRCAMCSWCCGCYYMLFVLLISGIMTAVSMPLSSVCLIMEDVDRQIITDIAAPLELDLSNEAGDMMIEMVEQCFVPDDPDTNTLILNLIKVNDTTAPSGTITMYELIVNQTRDSIQTSFDVLTDLLDTGDLSLFSTGSPIQTLVDTLQNTPLTSMMIPDVAALQADADYSAIFGDSTLQVYAASGGSCDNYTVPAGDTFGSLAGTTVEGLSDFGAALETFGTQSGPTTCTPGVGQVTCSPASAACEAGNNLMDLKLKLRNDAVFKCWKFVDGSGADCDVAAGVRSDCSTNCANRCLVNGAMVPREYDCNLEELSSQVQMYASKIEAVIRDLDTKTGNLQTRISADLKDLVEREVMAKITTVADGMTCGFLANTYQGVLDGLCYGGVWGFQAISASYVACAVLTILLVILTFIVWRISYDNVLMNSKDPIMRYDS